jgi:hypothetical protein
MFPKSAKPGNPKLQKTIKVDNYSKTRNGKRWEKLTDEEVADMRTHDFKEVGKKLRDMGITHTRRGGTVTIGHTKYTIHHHHKTGHFELIESKVHKKIGHIGMAIWHRMT